MNETRLPAADWTQRADLAALVDALDPAGEGLCRWVGGAVRDTLAGLAVKDIDMATRLRPDAVIARLNAAKIRAVPTGIASPPPPSRRSTTSAAHADGWLAMSAEGRSRLLAGKTSTSPGTSPSSAANSVVLGLPSAAACSPPAARAASSSAWALLASFVVS